MRLPHPGWIHKQDPTRGEFNDARASAFIPSAVQRRPMGESVRRHGDIHRKARHVGDDALRFMRWYAGGKYALMGGFLGELDDPPDARDAAALRDRFCKVVSHGRRVAIARTVVTALLALGVVTSAVAAIANAADLPGRLEGDVEAMRGALSRVAAWAATFAVVFVALRIAFDRYLDLVDTSATFLAMQLATTPRPPQSQ